MSDVTVTLTQEESNLIHHMLGNVISECILKANKTEELVKKNGSLSGKFGPKIAELDQAVINVYDDSIEFYSLLADKFPNTDIIL